MVEAHPELFQVIQSRYDAIPPVDVKNVLRHLHPELFHEEEVLDGVVLSWVFLHPCSGNRVVSEHVILSRDQDIDIM